MIANHLLKRIVFIWSNAPRLISGSIGLVLLSSAFRWTLDPETAAAGLAMALVEGPGDTTMA